MKRASLVPKGLPSLLLRLAVTSGLLAYAFFLVDFEAVFRVVGKAEPRLLALAIATLFCSYVLGGLRWWCVVKGLGKTAPVHLLISLFWLGGLVGQFLPKPLGDTVRVAVAVKRGMLLGTAIHSAVFERLIMVMALLVLVAGTEQMLRARIGETAPTQIAWMLLCGGLAGLVALAAADRLLVLLRNLPPVGVVVGLSAEFRRLLASRWSLPVYATAVLGHINLILSAAILGAALALPLTIGDYLAVMPVATVAMILPVSVGGWGVREGVLIAVLTAMGVPAESALAFSLLFGLCIATSSLPALATLWLGPKSLPSPVARVPADP